MVLIYTTFKDNKEANKISKGLIEANLAKCVNLFQNGISIYKWKNKATTSKDIINQKPEFRIQAFLDTCKKSKEKQIIAFTRQEIANFTGLRVETVIRTLSKMNQKNVVEIINHKIYY